MHTGTAPRILLAVACLAGLLGAVSVLTGALPVPAAPSAPALSAAAPAPVAVRAGEDGRDGIDGPGERATVLAVADPVTLDVRLEGGRTLRVRALGVQPPARCYAEQAMQFARGTLAGQAVTLRGDSRADQFSRALTWVSLRQGEYAVLAAEAGVVTSYAAEAPPERMGAVRAAQARAEGAGRGVWGPPCVTGPSSG